MHASDAATWFVRLCSGKTLLRKTFGISRRCALHGVCAACGHHAGTKAGGNLVRHLTQGSGACLFRSFAECVCVCGKFQDSRLCGWRFGFPFLAGPRLLAHVSSQHSILIWWVCTVSCALTKEELAAVVSSGTASSGEETSPQHSLPCVHEKEMR